MTCSSRPTSPVRDGRFGATARLSLTWAHGHGPPTMIVKLASTSPRTRRAGRLYRTYEVEAGFYQDMAGRVGAHVARCYHAAYEPETGGYCLLLEDITGAVQGDQVASCTPEHVLTALTELAGLHSSTFGDERLRVLPWLRGRSPVITSREAAAMALRWSAPFTTRLAGLLHTDLPRALDLLSAAAPGYGRPPRAGVALVHGDFRSENLLFRPGQAVVLDWQTAGTGAALADVSYFVGTSAADTGEPGGMRGTSAITWPSCGPRARSRSRTSAGATIAPTRSAASSWPLSDGCWSTGRRAVMMSSRPWRTGRLRMRSRSAGPDLLLRQPRAGNTKGEMFGLFHTG